MKGYKSDTTKFYDKNADKRAEMYKSFMNLKKRKEFKEFVELVPGKKILDLGCGGGEHALFFKGCGLNVECIDLSKKMIEICREKGLKAEVMDIEKLKFKDNTFHGIWAVTSLLHIPKKKIPDVVCNLSRILKKRGIIHVCLKEGDGEGFTSDKVGRRFFSYWKGDEMINAFVNYFKLVDFWKRKERGITFMSAFFRNNK